MKRHAASNRSEADSGQGGAALLSLAAVAALLVGQAIDYGTGDDGLNEVSNLLQLDAIRWDLNGDGVPQKEGGVTPGPERH